MLEETINARLAFLRDAEKLKSVLRSGCTSSGRRESTAEHSWRLALMALVFEDALVGLDIAKVLKLCIVHDLGEALGGDVPATSTEIHRTKARQERLDLLTLAQPLDPVLRETIVALWDEYEAAQTLEAKAVKALDKLETIVQHNQGANPAEIDYAFNLEYGRRYTDASPFFAALRELVDRDTRRRLHASQNV